MSLWACGTIGTALDGMKWRALMFLHGNIYLFQASHFSSLKALRMPSSLNQPASMRSDGGIPGAPNWPVDCKIRDPTLNSKGEVWIPVRRIGKETHAD